jgi:hypothetical protein
MIRVNIGRIFGSVLQAGPDAQPTRASGQTENALDLQAAVGMPIFGFSGGDPLRTLSRMCSIDRVNLFASVQKSV